MKLKPNEIELDNPGASYEPADMEALQDSYGITEGWVVPPVVYRDLHNRWKYLEGNNRLLLARKRGWGDTPIEVTVKEVPRKVRTDKDLIEWSLVRRAHVNGKRRRVPPSEWKAIFSKLRDELGWSQAQIARQCGWDEADVSRLLVGVTPSEHRQAIRERENVGAHQDSTPDDTTALSGESGASPPSVTGPSVEPEPRETVPTPEIVISGFRTQADAETVKKVLTPDSMDLFNRAIQGRFRDADGEDATVAALAIENLRWAHWHIGRKLLALGVSLFDPKSENPEA